MNARDTVLPSLRDWCSHTDGERCDDLLAELLESTLDGRMDGWMGTAKPFKSSGGLRHLSAKVGT